MNTTSNSQTLIDEYLSRRVLDRAEPELQVHKFGRKENIAKMNSKTCRWVRYAALAPSTTPLAEAVTPTPDTIATSDVEVIVSQYGATVQISDELEDTAAFNNLEQAADILSMKAKKSIETLVINELDAQAAVQFAGGGSIENDVTAADTLQLEDLMRAANSQAQDELDPHSDDKYIAILHRASVFDLQTDTQGVAFYDALKNTPEGTSRIIKGYLGDMVGLRFYVSDLMTSANNTLGTPVSLKSNYVLAYEPFGVVDIANRGIKVVRATGGADKADPLDQRRFVGYKFWYAVKYLQAGSKRAIRVRAASGN